jgi:hypothetical protein
VLTPRSKEWTRSHVKKGERGVPIWLWLVVLGYLGMLAAAALWAVVERTRGPMATHSCGPAVAELPLADAGQQVEAA